MQGNSNRDPWQRRVDDLLEKTIENGCTPDEEKSAIQLAFLLTRQHGLGMDNFRLALERVGKPPRYLITGDGFRMPATAWRSAPWDGVDRRRRNWDGNDRRRARGGGGGGGAAHAAADGLECPASPSGKHRMTPVMQGTFRTGYESCIHCGTRRRQE